VATKAVDEDNGGAFPSVQVGDANAVDLSDLAGDFGVTPIDLLTSQENAADHREGGADDGHEGDKWNGKSSHDFLR
jgi:hypothetical protein